MGVEPPVVALGPTGTAAVVDLGPFTLLVVDRGPGVVLDLKPDLPLGVFVDDAGWLEEWEVLAGSAVKVKVVSGGIPVIVGESDMRVSWWGGELLGVSLKPNVKHLLSD